MLALALTTLLCATPAAAEHATRAYLSQVEAPPAPPSIEPRRSLFDLNNEIKQLKADRPGLGFPIAFIAVGGGIAVIDALIIFTLVAFYGVSTYGLAPLFIVLGAALAGFCGTGFIVLAVRLGQRGRADARIAELEAEYQSREGREHPYNLERAPEPPLLPPPPPPPPPPSAGFTPMLEPRLVLAEF